MPLPLNDDWRIDGDTLNWILKRRKKEKYTDDFYWQTVGYYPNLEQAYTSFLEKRMRANSDDCETLLQVIHKSLQEIHASCEEAKINYAEYVELKAAQGKCGEPVEKSTENEDWGFLEWN